MHAVQAGGAKCRVRRDQDTFNLGHDLANQLDLRGVVIEEDQAVGADVELLGDPLQAFVFHLPAHFHADEVIPAQRHLRSQAEDLLDIGGIVLAAHREQHAASLDGENAPLQVEVSLGDWIVHADMHPHRSILAQDAAP
jgi:hypothetical protein